MSKIDSILRIAKNYYDNTEDNGSQRFKISAIITDSFGHIISKGNNSYSKTHPIQTEYANKASRPHKVFLHAEISALVKCRKIPHSVYVVRYLKNGMPGDAKPCPVCEMALREAGVKKVIYTSESGIEEYNLA